MHFAEIYLLLESLVMLSTTCHSLRMIRAFSTRRIAKTPPKDKSYRATSASASAKADPVDAAAKDRPFTLPPGLYRPKQSLGQNYLSDQNYVLKICDAFQDSSDGGERVVEIGPGMGALTRVLLRKYPKMTAIEIDQRSVGFLNEKLPELNVLNKDVLQFDWAQLAAEKGGKLSVVANLPYYITSQVLFSLADTYKAIDKAVVTMQWEVAERITAKPSTKDYGIPSVVFQLYGRTELNFKIPPKVFFPVPNVDSALITIDFSKPHKNLHLVEADHLRKVITMAFRQRRKMMRQSLKSLLERHGLTLPEKWSTMRPEQLRPSQFIDLTIDIFGARGSLSSDAALLVAPVPLINGAENKNLAKVLLNSANNSAGSSGSAKHKVPSTDSAEVTGSSEGHAAEEEGSAKRLLEVMKTRRERKIEASRTDGNADELGNSVVVSEPSSTTDEVENKKIVDKSLYLSDAVWRKALYG